ncbi:MAG: hypothetical protein QOF71_3110 [Candidatus Eremiobacteraeota bacterium]|nr:hypothetical protein [Candidatus Eremiobacteraeota bacterium]
MIDAGAGPKRARLRQMKTIATGLLAVMAIVFAIASRLRPAHPWLAWVEAFSEAALIGGLADWFAVVALFRHPGGVPLPHTAIVPNNKDRIGTQLGIFVEQNFLTPTLIASKLRELDLAGHVLRWFAVPRNCAALFANVRALVPRLLDAVDDGEIRAVVRNVVADEVAHVDLSRAAGGVLEIVTADGAHQRVLARILPLVAGWLNGQRAEIKRRFAKRSLLTPGFVDAYIVNRFVDGMVDLVEEIARTPDHPMRREFDASVRDFVVRLRDDPEMQAQAERLKNAILHGSELDQLVAAGWSALRARLERPPSESPESAGLRFAEITARIAREMLDEPALVERLNVRLCDVAESVLARFQQQFSALITEIVQRWDAAEISQKIETELGPDLQFIRLNGSLVGGAAGVLLHAALVVSGAA